MVRAGRPLPPELSLLKIWATETHERLGALLIQIAEEYGGVEMRLGYGHGGVHALAPYVNALAATIFSGTNEIQRNIYAKQVLGDRKSHTSELQSLMRISYAVFCLKQKKQYK